MATYAIGDLQGCFDPFMRLLDTIKFQDGVDTLWLAGDLVNRGPQSLDIIRFLQTLKTKPVITLGNHDLHLLGRIFTKDSWVGKDDTLADILNASDAIDIGHWLRKQKVLHYCKTQYMVMAHAGIAPCWTLEEAIRHANELETALQSDDFIAFLGCLYGNVPSEWSEHLQGYERLRIITNYFTRMRFCKANNTLLFDYKGRPDNAPHGYYPWYAAPNRKPIAADIVFGHWASLQGKCPISGIYAIDTACLWGGRLTALRIEDKQLFSVSS